MNDVVKPKILLVGESGSGKNTVQDFLVKKYGLKPLLSYTTREKRYPEEDTHTFITIQEYVDIKWKEEFIAYTFYNNNHYFATEKQLTESDIYIIDVDGIKYLKQNKTDIPYIVIYLQASEEMRIHRMRQRGDSDSAIMERIAYDRKAFSGVEYLSDYVLNNIDSEKTADQIYHMIYGKQEETPESKQIEISREIIDKLSQIQSLIMLLKPQTTDITIELNNCSSPPLSKSNGIWITCENAITQNVEAEIHTQRIGEVTNVFCQLYDNTISQNEHKCKVAISRIK